jgi:SpoVK/Ycf46/Vps4 family AAA+-type ATPase
MRKTSVVFTGLQPASQHVGRAVFNGSTTLLQRMETYNGLVILASNLAIHVDEAFARRFEQLVHFPMPRQNERHLIRKKGLPRLASLEPGADRRALRAEWRHDHERHPLRVAAGDFSRPAQPAPAAGFA